MFALGDKAFYPAHGVGVIEKIESKKVSEHEDYYYVIKIIDTGMTVMVPKSRASDVGLRPLTSSDKIEDVFKIFQKKNEKSTKTMPWNRRQRDYMAKLKSGSIFDLAEILRDLTLLQSQKTLSFGEKKLLETVRRFLIKELACCQNCSEDVVLGKINSLLAS